MSLKIKNKVDKWMGLLYKSGDFVFYFCWHVVFIGDDEER